MEGSFREHGDHAPRDGDADFNAKPLVPRGTPGQSDTEVVSSYVRLVVPTELQPNNGSHQREEGEPENSEDIVHPSSNRISSSHE